MTSSLVRVYAILFRTTRSAKEYGELAREAFAIAPTATVAATAPTDDTFAQRAVEEVCGDLRSLSPSPEIKIEHDDPTHFPGEAMAGGSMEQYAIEFLKPKAAAKQDPDYFNIPGYRVEATTTRDKITGDRALVIRIYK